MGNSFRLNWVKVPGSEDPDLAIMLSVKSSCNVLVACWVNFHDFLPDIQAEDQPVSYVTSSMKNGYCFNRQYAILKTLPLKSSMRQMAINTLWRQSQL